MIDEATIQHTLDEMVQRIVRTVHPRRIILFGSVARGQMGENSDLDVLVVMPDGTHRRQTARQLYRALFDLGRSKDIVVVTEEDVRRFGDEPSLVLYPALKEGRDLYRAS
jgi:predicted nucleotidyltransferase